MKTTTKYRQPMEWTSIIIKYISKDNTITDTETKYATFLLQQSEMESKKEVHTDKDKMWKQLNKYWFYLSTLNENSSLTN